MPLWYTARMTEAAPTDPLMSACAERAKSRGWSQIDMGRRLFVVAPHLWSTPEAAASDCNRYFRGKRLPSYPKAMAILSVLGARLHFEEAG